MKNKESIKTEETAVIFTLVKEICMRFPEVSEKLDSFGHTSFRVKDKPFVMMGEKDELSVAVKTLKETQEILLQQKGYSKTAYIGQHGWISVDTSIISDFVHLESLITEAYLRTAPKRLVNLFKENNLII
jgi:hypothetical protein